MPNEPRTPEEYIRQNYPRASDRRLAAQIRWTRTQVRAYREAHGLTRPDEGVASADGDDTALPEFAPRSRPRWLEPRVLTSRDVFAAAAVLAVALALYVASSSPVISSA